MPIENTSTTIVLKNVPTSLGTFLRPSFISSETTAAKHALSAAYKNHFLLSAAFSSFLFDENAINSEPIRISALEAISITIVKTLPLSVVSPKKKTTNKRLEITKLDLSIGATLLTGAKLNAL